MTTRKSTIKLPRSVKRAFPQVKTIVDATRAVEVSVNRRDCKVSKRLNATECALATAAKRELKSDGVIIGMGTSYVIKGSQAIRFETPESVQREIVSFDRHQDFAPGDYYLKPVSPSRKLNSGRSSNRTGGKDKNQSHRKIHHSARVRVIPKGME